MPLLEGIKIIDFTRLLPGPVATHLMAQMGAEVIKVESPKRMDYARFGLSQIDGASTLYHQLNHNKTELIIDYNTEKGKTHVLELIKDADAVIEQFRPGAMDSWGLGYQDLKKINPGLVYVSVTGYKPTGKFADEAGHDMNYLAYAGMMSLLKDENNKPVVSGSQFADISGSYMAVIALQAALIKKLKSGKGSHVNAPLADAVMPFLAMPYSYQSAGFDHEKFNIINGNVLVNYAAYECADGKWISLGALEIKFWNNFCELADKPEWKRENELELTEANFDKNLVAELFKSRTRDQWSEMCFGKDVCLAPILEIEELEDSEFHKSNGTFEEFTTPSGEKLKTIALPIKVIDS